MKFSIIIITLISILAVLHYNRNVLKYEYVIHDDVTQAVYWMEKFRDPDLFKDDLLTEYAIFQHGRNFLYVWIYKLLSKLASPITIEEFLPFLIAPLSMIALYLLLKKSSNTLALFISFVYLILPGMAFELMMGFQRNLALPIFFFSLYMLLNAKYIIFSICLILLSLLYPPLFLVSSFVSLIYLTFKRKNLHLLSYITASILLCLLILAFIYKDDIISGHKFSPLYTKKELMNMEEFYEGGRIVLFPQPSVLEMCSKEISTVFWIKDKKALIHILLFFILYSFIYNLRKREKLCLFFVSLILAGIILFELAKVLLLKLYEPNRYIHFTFPLFAIYNVFAFIISLKKRWLKIVIMLFLFVSILFLAQPYKKQTPCIWWFQPDLFKYISNLPKDVTIAAPPYLASFIPTFSKRKVFISYELSIPYYKGYYEEIRQRTKDFFKAYYASDANVVLHFCNRYKIDYFLINKRDFSPDHLKQSRIYINPFNDFIKKQIAKRHFFFENKNSLDIVFEQGEVYLVKCRRSNDN